MTAINRLLIANRGEIAVRIAKTCRALGIETVAIYSDADRRALHVLECDRAIHIGGSAPSESYLNIERIIAAAKESGADALHPGFGLLSENPALAEACAAAGLVFVGPSPEVMRLMGDKGEARRIAKQNNVPTVPGYDGGDQGRLAAKAKAIGYPVMIKAAAGGGGRGMRLVENAKQFAEAAESAHREAERAFGNGALILEKAIIGGRHIEIQVLADSHGNVVHLGERDCSTQRRHQKVIEESPSPAVDDAMRDKMGEAAVRLATAVGYVNAGTVEFLQDASGEYFFLEMNTRLQVEHGVTELCTGLDLVALQLSIAAGEPLPFSQKDVRFSGHAIECRVYAEDPQKNYLPSPGRITKLRFPTGEGVRNDVGTYEGDEISTYYDPMIAKLLTHGANRIDAIERMERALSDLVVEGVKTNVLLLRTIITHPVFRSGHVTTDFLDTQLTPEALADAPPTETLLAALGYLLVDDRQADPWRAAGPTGAGGVARVDLEYNGSTHTVLAWRKPGDRFSWMADVDGGDHHVRFSLASADRVLVEHDGKTIPHRVTATQDGLEVATGDRIYRFTWSKGERHRPVADGHRQHALTAPMHGLVLKVLAKPGDKVRAHQTLVVIEAMKMEHSIEAPHDGIVKAVHCKEGGRVTEGELLVELEPETSE
jgi:3-methylcrotonyl-CoA carboxylase alpha subunit